MPSDQKIHLDQKYTQDQGRIFLNGTQALVRLPMIQIKRDRAAGLNTSAFISGYRGSPLGSYDLQLSLAKKYLDKYGIVFQPGVNEDLAATAVWGSQQLHLSPGAKYDGVVGIWYGKGPGVDRSGDVLKHANAAGSSPHGGVLCLAGDDHGAKSSTLPHQSDHDFMSALMPVLYPSSIHEFIEMGLLGIAMSRYSGCWVGMKVISDTVETTAAIDLAGEARQFVIPEDFEIPSDGLNLRWPDDRWSQDDRLQNYKGYAAIAFAAANKVNQVTLDSDKARLGIVASGKAYEDVRQALRELEIDAQVAQDLGLRVYKVRMPWPLEPEGIRNFSLGLEEVLVVEERREIIENQIKQQLYNWRTDVRPRIIGKLDHHDGHVLSLNEELTVGTVARAIADRLLNFNIDTSLKQKIEAKVSWLEERNLLKKNHTPPLDRLPFYCSGCPHNSSTKVPQGSRAMAGIGCHFMVTWMDRNTETFSQMGGEGVSWTGTAPFTDENHVFVNLGDGTYFHSGHLAVRQAVASGANVTYKILYNDAVAMTGGQSVDGNLSPAKVTHQLHHEGVKPIYLLTESPQSYSVNDLAADTIILHRDELDVVMKMLRETPGCSAIVFVQTCAAEKRRRRKRNLLEDPAKRILINPLVCDGCGDCSIQSNCVSIEPLETEFGRKRQINQSTCNKDYSCVKGFCPSFVTVNGGQLRKKANDINIDFEHITEPSSTINLDKPYNIAVTGVGGTGVLTIGSLLGMAAYVEGNASMILDMSGLAQKGGSVISHVRIGAHAKDITSPRIVNGRADLLIAADSVVASSKDGISLCTADHTRAVVNTHLTPVAGFVSHRDFDFKQKIVESTIKKYVLDDDHFKNYSDLATKIIGDEIATNIIMLGYTYQMGFLPLKSESILKAIELNGVAINANKKAFMLGRLAAYDADSLAKVMRPMQVDLPLQELTTQEVINHRAHFLVEYQGNRLSARYIAVVNKVKSKVKTDNLDPLLVRAVAINYAKLLAYKDEYEVARLYTNGDFEKQLSQQFEGDIDIKFNLAPPILNGTDVNGRPKKQEYGAWMLKVFKLIAKLKGLRGTFLDMFGYHEDRKAERQLIKDYETLVDALLPELNLQNQKTAIELLTLPDQIRGFGPLKANSIAKSKQAQKALLEEFNTPNFKKEEIDLAA